MTSTALITGVTGQDGSYLAEYLLGLGYRVHGLVRNLSDPRLKALHKLCPELTFIEGDLGDSSSLDTALEKSAPTEVYNLGAVTFAGGSFEQSVLTGDVTGLGVTRVLDAIRRHDASIHFFQASSSEMFAGVKESPQNESTNLRPRSPYGAAKAYAHFVTASYRDRYGMFACSGILFNHESPRRGAEFVTRKIARSVGQIKFGRSHQLALGNLEARRDWGFAGDYVEAMYLMMQQPAPDDYVIATGESHSVREFCELAFAHADLDYRHFVVRDDRFWRPAERTLLVGDARNAHKALGWQPRLSFSRLVATMVDAELKELSGGEGNH